MFAGIYCEWDYAWWSNFLSRLCVRASFSNWVQSDNLVFLGWRASAMFRGWIHNYIFSFAPQWTTNVSTRYELGPNVKVLDWNLLDVAGRYVSNVKIQERCLLVVTGRYVLAREIEEVLSMFLRLELKKMVYKHIAYPLMHVVTDRLTFFRPRLLVVLP